MKTNSRFVLLDFTNSKFQVYDGKVPVSPLYTIEGPVTVEDVEYMRTYDFKEKA